MPNKKDEPVENKEDLQFDQPSVDDPDGRVALTHPEENYALPADSSYRPGDPPPSQSLFPPTKDSQAQARDASGENSEKD
jgi:hypothetical protein